MLLQHHTFSTTTMSSQHLKLRGQLVPTSQEQQAAAASAVVTHQQQHDGDGLYQKLPFPYKLHQLLEDVEKDGKQTIISWLPLGNAFKVHRPSHFTSQIMSNYFRQTQYKSFTRQVRMMGFFVYPIDSSRPSSLTSIFVTYPICCVALQLPSSCFSCFRWSTFFFASALYIRLQSSTRWT